MFLLKGGKTESGLYFTDAFYFTCQIVRPDSARLFYPLEDEVGSVGALSKWKITEKRKVLSSGLLWFEVGTR